MVITSLSLVLLVTECAMRGFAGPDAMRKPFGVGMWVDTDPVVGWRNRRGYEDSRFRINSSGFRGPEISRSPDGPRIVCLGDSGTFGVWVSGSAGTPLTHFDGYPAEMRRLAPDYGVAEVINTGVVGYNSSNGLRLLRTEIVDLDPDIVTIRFGVNDHRLSGNPNRRVAEPPNVLLRTLLYTLSDLQLFRVGLEAWTMAPIHPKNFSVKWVTPERFELNLRRFGQIARRHGIKLLLIDTPLRPIGRGENKHDQRVYMQAGYRTLADFHRSHGRYQALIAKVAAEEGLALLKTDALLAGSERAFFSDYDFVHPNRDGARVLGAAVLKELTRLGWIPGPDEGGRPLHTGTSP